MSKENGVQASSWGITECDECGATVMQLYKDGNIFAEAHIGDVPFLTHALVDVASGDSCPDCKPVST